MCYTRVKTKTMSLVVAALTMGLTSAPVGALLPDCLLTEQDTSPGTRFMKDKKYNPPLNKTGLGRHLKEQG